MTTTKQGLPKDLGQAPHSLSTRTRSPWRLPSNGTNPKEFQANWHSNNFLISARQLAQPGYYAYGPRDGSTRDLVTSRPEYSVGLDETSRDESASYFRCSVLQSRDLGSRVRKVGEISRYM